MKINVASFNPVAADIKGNAEKIIGLLHAFTADASLLVLPEAALCGCPLFDLFEDKQLLAQQLAALKQIAPATKEQACVLGYADKQAGQITTAAAFIYKGKITKIFDTETISFQGKTIQFVLSDPQDTQADPDADLVIFLQARPYIKGNVSLRLEALKKFAKKHGISCVLCNLLGSGDGMIFDGLTAATDTKGNLLYISELFKEQLESFDTDEKHKPVSYHQPLMQELVDALSFGVGDYVTKSGFDKVVLGVSGGIDSAVTAALAARALGGESVFCVSIPSYCTSDLSKTLAGQLAVKLEVNLEEVGVKPLLETSKEALAHIVSHPKDLTTQALQSRLRTDILAALAAEYQALLLSTDDKSESLVGPLMIYGQSEGDLQPIGDLYKTEVYEIADWLNKQDNLIPRGIIERAPTSELKPNQKDEDVLPPYSVLDKLLKGYMEEGKTPEELAKKLHLKTNTVNEVLARVNKADLSRRKMPPALQVSDHPLALGVRPVIKKVNL